MTSPGIEKEAEAPLGLKFHWPAASAAQAFPLAPKRLQIGAALLTYSCSNHYTQPIVVVKRSKCLFFRPFSAHVQNEPITTAVQPAPHIRAPAAIVDLVAVANVETRLGAVPPNRALDEPGKHLWKPSD